MADPKLTEAQCAALDRIFGGDGEVYVGAPDGPETLSPGASWNATLLSRAEAHQMRTAKLVQSPPPWGAGRLIGAAQGRLFWQRQRRAAP